MLPDTEIYSALGRCQNKSGSKPTPVVIIGNGPSGICLSYLLSGYTPYFKRHSLHPHPILQSKLEEAVDVSILDQDLEYLSEGLEGRSNSPVALLFDTLLRPDTDLGLSAESVLTWRHETDRAIPHLVLGKNPPGGAWHSIEGSMITLSRGEWMGLPDLQFKDWLKQKKRFLEELTKMMMGSCPWRSSRPFFPMGHSMRRNSRSSSTPLTQTTQNYFADHMGDYEDVLASLETLNLSILKAMDYTKRVYESGSNVDQFVTRFLLKETANQTQSLLSSVESAVDAIDEQTNPSRQCSGPASLALTEPWYSSPVPSYAPPGRIVPRGHGKSGAPEPRQDGLEGQIGRLAALIGRLEDKTLWFDLHQQLSDSKSTACSYLLLVRDEMTVSHKHLSEFCSSLKQYLKSVAGEQDCFHITAVKLPDGVTFIVYEFWETEEDWKRHLQSAACKGFQHVKVDALSQPEAVSSVAVPAAWCTLSQD